MAGPTPEQMAEMLRALGMQSGAGGVDLEKLRERMMERPSVEFNSGGSDLASRRKQFERMLSRTTDLARNRSDAFGDGDQSPVQACVPRLGPVAARLRSLPARVRSGVPGSAGQDLIDVWSAGADFNPECSEMSLGLSALLMAAFFGDASAVEKGIAAARARGAEALTQALERRETLLRFTPLHSCTSGARVANTRRGADHVRVARALLDAGARPNAKDVAGYTPVFHCTFHSATATSLAILPLVIAAGGDVNLRNRAGRCALIEPTMNGRGEIVEMLMKAGADPRLRDNCGGAATSCAVFNPTAKRLFAEYIKKHGKTEDEPPTLAVVGGALLGRRVRLTGLAARPELNGRTGVAVEFVEQAERYTVRLDSENAEGKVVRVKPGNLLHDVVLAAACTGCGAAGARRRCSRCMTVFYCSSTCQRSHWPNHKAPCGAAASALVATVPPRDVVPSLLPLPHIAGPQKPRHKGEPPKEGRSFVVKVQLPHHVAYSSPMAQAVFRSLGMPTEELPAELKCDPENDALIIYNDDRSVLTSMLPSAPGYDRLVEAIVSSGGTYKAYLRATRAADGTLKISFGEMLPDEKW